MDTNNREGSAGPVIATIIILAVVVLGGLYFWGQRNSDNNSDIYGNPVSSSTPSSIDTQSSSDNPASIQSDLKSTNTENLGSQINAS